MKLSSKKLMDDIARITQSQREELALVCDTENHYSSSSPQPEKVNRLVDNEASRSQPITDSEDSILTPLIEEMKEKCRKRNRKNPSWTLDWEDLMRENWSENDKLHQGLESVRSVLP